MLAIYALCMAPPTVAAVYSGARHLLDRHAHTVAFTRGRERRLRPNQWRQ